MEDKFYAKFGLWQFDDLLSEHCQQLVIQNYDPYRYTSFYAKSFINFQNYKLQ